MCLFIKQIKTGTRIAGGVPGPESTGEDPDPEVGRGRKEGQEADLDRRKFAIYSL